MKKRNIKMIEKLNLSVDSKQVFFLDVNDQCNLLCIKDGEFLFDYKETDENSLLKLKKLYKHFKKESNIKSVPLPVDGIYKDFRYDSYDLKNYVHDFEKNKIKEYFLTNFFTNATLLFLTDDSNKVRAYTMFRYYGSKERVEYYQLSFINDETGKISKTVSFNDTASLLRLRNNFYHDKVTLREQIEKNPIDLGYKFLHISGLIEENILEFKHNLNEDYLSKQILALSKYANVDEVINSLNSINLSQVKEVYIKDITVHAPGDYSDITRWTASLDNLELENNKFSIECVGKIII